MFNPTFFKQKFEAAHPYPAYVSTGTAEQQRRWNDFHIATSAFLSVPAENLLTAFTRQMHILVVSGIWCGDCVQQVPLLHHIAQANASKIDLRILDRDQHKDLSSELHINAGDRVPVVLFLSEDFEFCALAGDRTLNRYRALAAKQLGPACPLPLAPIDQDEVHATLNDWVAEFERVHLMLRLSARLRKKHND